MHRAFDIRVTYTQRGEGVPEDGKTITVSQKQGSLDARMLLTCANPACKKGGYLLRKEITAMLEAKETARSVEKGCAGYVGSLRTERGPADGCPNTIEATIEVQYGPKG